MFRLIFVTLLLFININASMSKERLESFIEKPYILGEKDKNIPVWEILDKNKKLHSYIFETYDYAPIAGFSGGKMNLLVSIDLQGNFLDVHILEQDEPVFVSGLGIIPFINFLKQYKGKSLKNSIKVGTSKDQTSSVHIDGVTKATASVKIANDIILGSAVQVAKEKLLGVAPKEIHNPKKDLFEKY
ncbi:4Fe-4S binding protein, partial [bacterium]|nr:4Fe-4S binding protein [bacterium]